jgi:hypothetical protein
MEEQPEVGLVVQPLDEKDDKSEVEDEDEEYHATDLDSDDASDCSDDALGRGGKRLCACCAASLTS